MVIGSAMVMAGWLPDTINLTIGHATIMAGLLVKAILGCFSWVKELGLDAMFFCVILINVMRDS